MLRTSFYVLSLIALAVIGWSSLAHPGVLYALIVVIPLILVGLYDIFVSHHNVLSNYPVIGHLRYIMEFISPEIRQYFVESDKSGRPYTRQERGLIKARSYGGEAVHPFGTEYDVDENGYKLALHSLAVKKVPESDARVTIGGPQCKRPYNSSRLNISAMSFGALSSHAVMAMNKGAKLGGFAQDTGEGGLTPYHLKFGADIIWEIGSGYFGCRTREGRFDDEQFRKKACQDVVKMIEIKLSQGAKPSHGGVLPASKVDAEIARIRGVPQGQDCVSPAAHPEFDSPKGLMQFVERLRNLSEGRPVGFKLCVGQRREFLGICKAMLETGILPDFITVDGAEGGTGAAPVEYSDRLGLMIDEGLSFVHNALVGCGLRDKIRLIASGKITDGFDMMQKISLGADVCNVARPMMFAVGCIQAQRCHTNTCPTGVATQDKRRGRAVDIENRGKDVMRYHDATIKSFLDITGSVGAAHPGELHAGLVFKRQSNGEPRSYAELYPPVAEGALVGHDVPEVMAAEWAAASVERF